MYALSVNRPINHVRMDNATKGKAVNRLRIRLRMTQQELADELGISLSQVANIEIGRGRISDDVEAKLVRLGYSVDAFDADPEPPIRIRGTRRQLKMLIQILEDCEQHPELRKTAALELRAALDLNS